MILDHTEPIELTGQNSGRFRNEVNTLAAWRAGLDFLDAQIRRIERGLPKPKEPGESFVVVGNHPAMRGVPLPLVRCAYDWYSVTASNYARLVGWIRMQVDEASPTPVEYARRVLPEVQAWRDKIGAHPARFRNDSRDVDAERIVSVIPNVGLVDGLLHAGPLRMAVRRGGVSSDSSAIPSWSITTVHQAMRERYWPRDAETEGDGGEDPTSPRGEATTDGGELEK